MCGRSCYMERLERGEENAELDGLTRNDWKSVWCVRGATREGYEDLLLIPCVRIGSVNSRVHILCRVYIKGKNEILDSLDPGVR